MTDLPNKPWLVGDSFETERGLTYTFDGVRWLSDGDLSSAEGHSHDDLALKNHSHSYASTSHTHNYASTSHTHSFSGGLVSLTHGYGTSMGHDGGYGATKHFPYYWGGSRHYWGGKFGQTGKIELTNSNFYNKCGHNGTLIGSTSSGGAYYPHIIFQVYETEYWSSGIPYCRFYGTPIYTRYADKSWSDDSTTLYWYWRGFGK